jgi:hypothetical protein
MFAMKCDTDARGGALIHLVVRAAVLIAKLDDCAV